ncbi:TIGR04283 family arsenosugar biosynthesis glycosyltransferase [Spectribacter hydrogenoxidans]|uniref:TIGR04283 family arsenosugar biosynthesis glycosyltransferase n=1 Tax=Spectribacter hydrogenoxidans TaxID=3075608 RepID=A0ABU3C2E0_9GAMM|nr:TIGR04283 family arsenosugar biosynthesis glycosyltransferase [Salinisphaera sp. W335]MDT0635724.1 TIGR04283 family arsenosugar biosynthesis glycosyltransferase [Salinisphaera sp. W335]
MKRLSVIIPVLDEAGQLPALFDALAAQRGVDLEIIVADGGSHDASRLIAARRGAEVIAAETGRARQMNAGAARAHHDWLLFLHADSHPTGGDQLAEAVVILEGEPPHTAGHFALRFQRKKRGHGFLYRYMEAKSASNRPYTINGDQGLLIRRDWFRELGGFDPALPFLEDQRMAAAIHTQGRWLRLPGRLTTSARRFESEGSRQRYRLMAMIMVAHVTGLTGFFEAAPDVYRQQRDTGRLLLTPYFRLLRRQVGQLDPDSQRAFRQQLGRFAVDQAWQIFFAVDVLAEPLLRGQRPATTLHDRLLAPLLQHPIAAALAARLVITVSLTVIAPWYRWRERRALRRARPA